MIGPAKEKRSISYLRGYPIATRYGPVIPSFHPAYLARGKMQYLGLLMRDISIAIEVAQGRREVVFDPARVVEYGPHNMKGALELEICACKMQLRQRLADRSAMTGIWPPDP